MRGRKPKPLQVQIAEGDPRRKGVRKLLEASQSVVKAPSGLPPCPEYLRGPARHAWEFWKNALESMSLDRMPDALTLEIACQAYEAAELYYEAKAFAKMDRHQKTLRSFTSDFGLSPVSRERLTLEKPADGDDDFVKSLSGPRASALQ